MWAGDIRENIKHELIVLLLKGFGYFAFSCLSCMIQVWSFLLSVFLGR